MPHIARALGASVAVLLAGASPAIAQQRDSSSAAAVAGTDATWLFHGKTITPAYARTHAPVCVEDASAVTRCYDTNAQAERSTATARGKSYRARNKKKSLATASCSPGDSSQLKLYMDSSYNGYQLNLATVGGWYNIPSAYNDDASSWQMGGVSGRISEHTLQQGLGYEFPGPSGACDGGTNMSGYSYQGGGGNWNDRASARARG